MENIITFTSKYNSKIVAYFIECRDCAKQYNGSTVTKFCPRTNNYKSTNPIFRKNKNCHTKRVTRKVFINIIFRVTITEFMAGTLQ